MNRAFLYLIRRSVVNGVRFRLSRLKSPRYLVPTLVGVAYFAFVFLWPVLIGRRTGDTDVGLGALMEVGILAMILLSVTATWIFARKMPTLFFTEAEVQLLFPAPLTRRQLIRYRLLRAQPGIVLMTVFFMVFRFWMARGGHVAFAAVGFYCLLNALMLHQGAASLTTASLMQHGAGGLKRALPTLAVLAAVIGSIILSFRPPAEPLQGDALFQWMKDSLKSGPAGVTLWPLWQLALLPLAPDAVAFLKHLVPVVVLLGALYVWVTRSDAAFEDAAVSLARKRSAALEAVRRGRMPATAAARGDKPVRRPLFPLARRGPAWRAVAWKNMVAQTRNLSPALIAIGAAFLVMASVLVLQGNENSSMGAVVAAMVVGFSVMLTFIGPGLLREDLRADLEHIDLVKTFPLTGRALLRGEAYAGAFLVSAVQMVLVMAGAAFVRGGGELTYPLVDRMCVAVGVGLVLTALTTLSFALENGMVLLFPAWVLPEKGAPAGAGGRGVEAMGLGIVTTLGRMLAIGVLFVPPAIFGTGVALAGMHLVGMAGVAVAGLITAAIVIAETELALAWFGRRFETLDASAEGLR